MTKEKDMEQSTRTFPTVSVVMATYNGAKYLREQLDSILAQTYPVSEIIIQDDGSVDATPVICHEYEERYGNIRFFQNTFNLGFNRNFQTAVMRATGEYIALSDQDDIWFPEKIEKQVAAIGDHDACYSAHTRGKDMHHARVVCPKCSPEAQLFYGFAGHTMLFRRDFIQNLNNWIPYIIYDWGLELSAHAGKGIAFVPQPLNWHRSNEESACAVMNKKNGVNAAERPTWQPYLYGWRNYRRLQQESNWKPLYEHVSHIYTKNNLHLAQDMVRLMLSRSPWALLRLCLICCRHRTTIYPGNVRKGWKGMMRGFFFPFIFAYHNYEYRLNQ